jgi:hypothetical protein
MKILRSKIGPPHRIEGRIKLMLVLVTCALLGAALGQASGVKSVLHFAVAAAKGNPVTQNSGKSDLPPKTKQKSTKTRTLRSPAVAPANDNCASAIPITSCPFTNTQDTTDATDEVGEPESTCTTQGNSVWYSYTSSGPYGASVTVNTCASAVDTAIMVWRVNGGACDFGTFVPVACNDDFACGDGLQSSVTFVAEPGQTYKIQVGGFDGETGTLVVNVACQNFVCPQTVIHGTLGSNDPTFPGPRASGNQIGRLNRNGIASNCAAPKTCQIIDPAGARAYDAYTFANTSGADQCVSVQLTGTGGDNNLQSNAYLGSYDPNNICTNYLADPGLSLGVPPTPTNFSFVVPAGTSLIVVVHTTNPGETGGTYDLFVQGDLCSPCPTFSMVPSLPNGATSVAYNQAVTTNPTGSSYTFAVTTNTLPPGLSLDSNTGVITGTPSAPGNYTFTITATGTNGCPTRSQSYNLVITGTCPTITVNPTSLVPGTHGAAYNATVSATGGVAPYTFSVFSGALPGGLTLNAASGLISGTPTATGTFVFTIRATGVGGCTGQRTYVLAINCGTITIDTALPNGTKNVAYNQTLTASPAGTYTFNVQTGSLPPGFTLSSAGVLSGTSSTTGTYTFTVRARTASGCQGTRQYTISINNAP